MNKKFNLFFVIISLLLIIIGTFFDYQISSYLFDKNNLFSIIFSSYGMLPALFFISLSGLLLTKNNKLIIKIVGYLLIILGITLGIYNSLEYGLDNIYISIIINVVIYILGIYTVYNNYLKEKNDLKLVYFIIIYVLAQIILINLIKIIWNRPRMILLVNDYNYKFVPWYIINKLAIKGSDLFKSFPSAHLSNATCSLILLAINPKKRNYILVFLFIIFTGLSRIIIGAHFLSDVGFGMLISFVLYLVFYELLVKNK